MGGAALTPASLSLVTTTFGGEERNRALGVYGAMAALGFVVGMVLGGFITEYLGWRWVLFVNVPVALAVLLLAPVAIAEGRDDGAPLALDVPGAATATLGLASLIYAIFGVPEDGWASPETLGFAALGALLLGGFMVVERRVEAPLVPPGVFGARAVTAPNAATLLRSMVGISWLFVLTLYFQEIRGHGPLETGFFSSR